MKNVCYKLIVVLFMVVGSSHLGISQDNSDFDFTYKVNRTYPSLSITKEKLNEARTLADLNQYYKPSWVKAYISVEISASCEGEIKKALSDNNRLNPAQKDLMNTLDADTDISVKIDYIPNNTLKHNDPKEMTFTLAVEPENEATYPGGTQQLQQYLKENVGDKIAEDVFSIYHLAAVNFTIDEEGRVVDAHLFEGGYQSFEHEKTKALLLEAICNMPNWTPAKYADGTKVKQGFVLTVGDHRSCVVNLLNIRREDM